MARIKPKISHKGKHLVERALNLRVKRELVEIAERVEIGYLPNPAREQLRRHSREARQHLIDYIAKLEHRLNGATPCQSSPISTDSHAS